MKKWIPAITLLLALSLCAPSASAQLFGGSEKLKAPTPEVLKQIEILRRVVVQSLSEQFPKLGGSKRSEAFFGGGGGAGFSGGGFGGGMFGGGGSGGGGGLGGGSRRRLAVRNTTGSELFSSAAFYLPGYGAVMMINYGATIRQPKEESEEKTPTLWEKVERELDGQPPLAEVDDRDAVDPEMIGRVQKKLFSLLAENGKNLEGLADSDRVTILFAPSPRSQSVGHGVTAVHRIMLDHADVQRRKALELLLRAQENVQKATQLSITGDTTMTLEPPKVTFGADPLIQTVDVIRRTGSGTQGPTVFVSGVMKDLKTRPDATIEALQY